MIVSQLNHGALEIGAWKQRERTHFADTKKKKKKNFPPTALKNCTVQRLIRERNSTQDAFIILVLLSSRQPILLRSRQPRQWRQRCKARSSQPLCPLEPVVSPDNLHLSSISNMDASRSLCQPSHQRRHRRHDRSFPTHLADSHRLRHSSDTGHQPPKQAQDDESPGCRIS